MNTTGEEYWENHMTEITDNDHVLFCYSKYYITVKFLEGVLFKNLNEADRRLVMEACQYRSKEKMLTESAYNPSEVDRVCNFIEWVAPTEIGYMT